jgi:hypothetical protein
MTINKRCGTGPPRERTAAVTSTPEWPNQGGVPSQQGPFNNPAWQPVQPMQAMQPMPMQAMGQPTAQPAGAPPWGPPQVGAFGQGPAGVIGPGGTSGYIGPVSFGNSYGGPSAGRFQTGMSFAGGSIASKLFGLVFVLAGIGVAVLGVFGMQGAKIPKSLSASASGTVVALNLSYTRSTNGGGSTTCNPIATFQVGTQQLIARAPGSIQSGCDWYQGETVNVRYDPNQPGHADIATGIGSRSTTGIMFIIFGVVFAAAGLLSTFRGGFGFIRIGSGRRAY